MIREYLIYRGKRKDTGVPYARQRAVSPERAVALVRRRLGLAGRQFFAQPASDAPALHLELADEN